MSLLYPDLGCMCRVPGCGKYDLLASQCRLCGAVTCTEHLQPALHACTGLVPAEVVCGRCNAVVRVDRAALGDRPMTKADLAAVLREHETTMCPGEVPKRAECGVAGCTDDRHVMVKCAGCGKSHCVGHRFPEDHECEALVKPAPPPATGETGSLSEKAAALPFYAWGFANTPESLDCSRVAESLRFGLRVFFAPALRRRPRYLCASRAWTVGKVLDLACHDAALPNRNNVPGAARFKVSLLWGACPVLPMGATMGTLLGEFGTRFRMGSGVMVHTEDALPSPIVSSVPRWLLSVQMARLGPAALETSIRARTFYQRLDAGPSLPARLRRVWDGVPGGAACLGAYVLLLCVVGWFDFS
eukprot:TRINITY_DN5652_c0_g1_i1.p1 TRINITY_DN5652_c0_g1~~TRINITY_DN5652_c0_g1_i1.p1  ORF type:complete len:358 (+),score=56.81 TRINITY_DN5652_c0_g1_i1:163-1236(+)